MAKLSYKNIRTPVMDVDMWTPMDSKGHDFPEQEIKQNQETLISVEPETVELT